VSEDNLFAIDFMSGSWSTVGFPPEPVTEPANWQGGLKNQLTSWVNLGRVLGVVNNSLRVEPIEDGSSRKIAGSPAYPLPL
jgi:hypothetical protein